MLEGDPEKGREGRQALGICSDVVQKYVQELLPAHPMVICCFFFLLPGGSLLFRLDMEIPPPRSEQVRPAAGWGFPGGPAAACPGPDWGPELSVLVRLVRGKGGGRERAGMGRPGCFLHTLGERGLPRLPFWSVGKEIRRGRSWDSGSVTFIRPFPLSLP